MSDPSRRVTVWLGSETRQQVEDEYVNWRYDSLSNWLREAAETRMAVEDALATQGVELPSEEAARRELIQTVVRAGVAARGDDLPTGSDPGGDQ